MHTELKVASLYRLSHSSLLFLFFLNLRALSLHMPVYMSHSTGRWTSGWRSVMAMPTTRCPTAARRTVGSAGYRAPALSRHRRRHAHICAMDMPSAMPIYERLAFCDGNAHDKMPDGCSQDSRLCWLSRVSLHIPIRKSTTHVCTHVYTHACTHEQT